MAACQRLIDEYDRILKSPLVNIGCTVGLCDGNNLTKNFYKWRCTLAGPKDSPYEGGLFIVELTFPENYPQSAPQIRFLTPIYHLNICPYKGSLGIVYPSFINDWNPSMTPEDILTKLYTIFYFHNPDSSFDINRSFEYKNNKSLYELKIAYFTKKYSNPYKIKNYDQDWDFSCDEKKLKCINKLNEIKKDKNENNDEMINVFFHYGNQKIEIKCKLKEKTESLIKKFFNSCPIKFKYEPLFILCCKMLNKKISIGNNNIQKYTRITVIDIADVVFLNNPYQKKIYE